MTNTNIILSYQKQFLYLYTFSKKEINSLSDDKIKKVGHGVHKLDWTGLEENYEPN